jgi:hypothetical protein
MEKTISPNSIATMMKLQRGILDVYIDMEGLPTPPLNLQDRDDQKTMKEFVRRFIEELSEAYESIKKAYVCANVNQNKEAQTNLKKFNIEVADAWHFFLEILIYSDVDEDVMEELIKSFVEDYSQFQAFYTEGRPFKFFLTLGNYLNMNEDRKCIQAKGDRFIIAGDEEGLDNPLLYGGRRVSERLMEYHAELLWAITNECFKLTNFLNNSDWHQTERQVNMIGYKTQIIYLLIAMGTYMDFIGMGEIQIVANYKYKNEINWKRIKEGY